MMAKRPHGNLLLGIAVAILGLATVVQGVAQQHSDDRAQKRDHDRQIQIQQTQGQIQQTQACITRVVKQFLEVNQTRSDASGRRDSALVGSKKALRELIRLRVIEGIPDGPQVQQAAKQYMYQTGKFIKASHDLDMARKNNPIPKFKNYCADTSSESTSLAH